MTEEETTETQEEIPVLASGLSIAFGYSDAPEPESGAGGGAALTGSLT